MTWFEASVCVPKNGICNFVVECEGNFVGHRDKNDDYFTVAHYKEGVWVNSETGKPITGATVIAWSPVDTRKKS